MGVAVNDINLSSQTAMENTCRFSRTATTCGPEGHTRNKGTMEVIEVFSLQIFKTPGHGSDMMPIKLWTSGSKGLEF